MVFQHDFEDNYEILYVYIYIYILYICVCAQKLERFFNIKHGKQYDQKHKD